MCVAIYKPANVKTPNLDTLKMCWDSNPDGAGFAYREPSQDGKFQFVIHKGYMKWKHFKEAYKKYELDKKIDTEMIIHFRITTHGGTCQGNCHPFPIVSDITLLKTTNVRTNTVLVHNGILPINPEVKDISDTMELCRRISRGGFYTKPKEVLELLEGFAGTNKLCIMSKYSETSLLGDWKILDGVYYSNLNWQWKSSLSWKDSFKEWSNKFSSCIKDTDDESYDVYASYDDFYVDDCVNSGVCPMCESFALTKTNKSKQVCEYCASQFVYDDKAKLWKEVID